MLNLLYFSIFYNSNMSKNPPCLVGFNTIY